MSLVPSRINLSMEFFSQLLLSKIIPTDSKMLSRSVQHTWILASTRCTLPTAVQPTATCFHTYLAWYSVIKILMIGSYFLTLSKQLTHQLTQWATPSSLINPRNVLQLFNLTSQKPFTSIVPSTIIITSQMCALLVPSRPTRQNGCAISSWTARMSLRLVIEEKGIILTWQQRHRISWFSSGWITIPSSKGSYGSQHFSLWPWKHYLSWSNEQCKPEGKELVLCGYCKNGKSAIQESTGHGLDERNRWLHTEMSYWRWSLTKLTIMITSLP